MVRPILEYASIVWSPHTQCDIHKIKMVQRRAVRFIFNNFSRIQLVLQTRLQISNCLLLNADDKC